MRETISMYYIKGKTQTEISIILGIHQITVSAKVPLASMDIKGPVTFAIPFSPPQKVMIAHVSSAQRPIAPLLIARFKGMLPKM
jgi:DNA-binding transcriptional regulator LsrR (DeoR family)